MRGRLVHDDLGLTGSTDTHDAFSSYDAASVGSDGQNGLRAGDCGDLVLMRAQARRDESRLCTGQLAQVGHRHPARAERGTAQREAPS